MINFTSDSRAFQSGGETSASFMNEWNHRLKRWFIHKWNYVKHKQFEDLQIIRRNRKTKREEKNLKKDKFRAETFARSHIMMSINVALAVDFCLLFFFSRFCSFPSISNVFDWNVKMMKEWMRHMKTTIRLIQIFIDASKECLPKI